MAARSILAMLAGVTFPGMALAQDAPGPTGDPAAGHKIAAGICMACHGMNGLATMPDMPTIAGADAAYLYKQLQAYKSGARNNEQMSAVAPMLDEQKMADAAAYYAAVHVTATPP